MINFSNGQGNSPRKAEEEPIKLSKYEDPVVAVEYNDLAEDALQHYRAKAEIAPHVGTEDFDRLLRQQGLLSDNRWVTHSNGFWPSALRQESKERDSAGGCISKCGVAEWKVVSERI